VNKKNPIILITVFVTVVFISGCGSSSNQINETKNESDNEEVSEENNSNNTSNNDSTIKENNNNSSNKNSNNNSKNNEEESNNNNSKKENTEDNPSYTEESEALAEYSSEEIEYARVWLEVIDHKDIKTLNVSHRSKGTPVNQYDDESVNYPERVTYLGADVTAKGGVVYSSNGDGTINLYNVPSHWPSPQQIKSKENQTMKEYTQHTFNIVC